MNIRFPETKVLTGFVRIKFEIISLYKIFTNSAKTSSIMIINFNISCCVAYFSVK